jgi:hypothetical protein
MEELDTINTAVEENVNRVKDLVENWGEGEDTEEEK